MLNYLKRVNNVSPFLSPLPPNSTLRTMHNAYDVSPKKKREKNNFPNEQADVTMDYRKIISTL